YPDAVRTFSSILNFISRMRQYHTKSYQYDQINKMGDRMYALLAMCHALSPSRLDDNIMSVIRERFGDQYNRMVRGGPDGQTVFHELFTYACPKFISANPPPYHDPDLLQLYMAEPPLEPAQRHEAIFLADVRTLTSVPTLRSFLKLYKSLDTKRLAGLFVDPERDDADAADAEEALIQQMMVLKLASRSVSRSDAGSSSSAPKDVGVHLGGSVVSTNDLDFVIDDNMVHIVESTVGRRFAGWFIRNAEHTQRVLDNIKSSPLPVAKPTAAPATAAATAAPEQTSKPGKTVAWGGAKS
ncbi:hypothetical protein FRC01_011835, partial [Tulasnella sp. 417]